MREVAHYLDDDPVSLGVARLSGLASILDFSPLCQLLAETRERQRLDSLPPRIVTRELVDRPVCTAAEFQAITDDFERRLESIAIYCESIGTLPIYVIPPGNDAGFDPSRSVLAPRHLGPSATLLPEKLRTPERSKKKNPPQRSGSTASW